MKYFFIALSFFILAIFEGCSSSPSSSRDLPPWINQPTRVVDNGYIVYVGSGEEVSSNEAELAAEGMAIQDLANECSFIPKGTRVEDRYSEKQKNTYKAYAKVGVEIEVCNEASKTIDPVAIKNMASSPFTEELKKFEDSIQDNRDEVVDAGIPPEQMQASQGGGSGISSNVHFFMARQYVVYQNQAVILSPPTAYAPGSPEYQTYATNVRPVVGHLQTYAAQNPSVRTNPGTWSSMASQVRAERPQSFRNPNPGVRHNQLRPPPSSRGAGRKQPRQNYPSGRGRHRRGYQDGNQTP